MREIKAQEVYELKEGVELPEYKDLNVFDITPMSSSKHSVHFPIRVPPFGKKYMEIGFVTLDGPGRYRIYFDSSFSGTPVLLKTKFGWTEIKLWWIKLRIPNLCFLYSVNNRYFEVFNFWGKVYISYIAIER